LNYLIKLFVIIGLTSITLFIISIFLITKITNPPVDNYYSEYDAIVILSGNPERAKLAGKLYQENKSKIILLSKENKLLNDYFGSREPIETYRQYIKILKQNNIPQKDIILFGNNNRSTFEEAKALSDLESPQLKNILIITNKYHVFRAKRIFDQIMPQQTIHFLYPEFYKNNDNWLKNKISIIIVFTELAKIILFFLFDDFDGYLAFSS
tara:strand:- start:1364 stop:1993 length:630 start_codon:yes stop_codon:yes gene_type:complete